MEMPRVEIDPVAEAIAKKLFGYDRCPPAERDKMIMRAVEAGRVAVRKELTNALSGLMPESGLKDRNGVEFCKGHIVQHNPDDDDWTDQVVWWAEKERLELDSYVKTPNPVTNFRLAEVVFGTGNPSIIIGNMTDNPELLED